MSSYAPVPSDDTTTVGVGEGQGNGQVAPFPPPPTYDSNDSRPIPPSLEPSHVSPQTLTKRFEADAHGRFRMENRPGCLMRCFMCLCCTGCFLSQSSNIEFDDTMQTITIQTWNGYLFCCKNEPVVIDYQDVANVMLGIGNLTINNQKTFHIILVTKNGNQYRISDPALAVDQAPILLGYHRFFFGRAKPDYQAPAIESLVLQI